MRHFYTPADIIRVDQVHHRTTVPSRFRMGCRRCQNQRWCSLPDNVLSHLVHVAILFDIPPKMVLHLPICQLGPVPEIPYRYILCCPQSRYSSRYRSSFRKFCIWIQSQPRTRCRQRYRSRSSSTTIHRLRPKSTWVYRLGRSGSLLAFGASVDATSPAMELRTFPTWSPPHVPDHWSPMCSWYRRLASMADVGLLPRFPDFVGSCRASHSTVCRIPTSACYDPYP
jgi:hypothetical protein